MNLFQVLLLLFFIFAIWKVIARFRLKELPLGFFLFWLIFWILAAVVVAWPNLTASAAKLMGIGRGVDLVVYITLAALFWLVFRLIVRTEKTKQEITRLTRELALRDKEKNL